MIQRRKSKIVQIGSLAIGCGEPIPIQSMLSTPWQDQEGNIAEARSLVEAGCEILRVAIPTPESVSLIPALKKEISIPLVADIHFNYQLALASAEAGIDKIRINPGNIGDDDRVRQVAEICKKKGIPIRIGVNSGSIEKNILKKYGEPTPEAMVESALYHASLLEKFDFTDIVLSMKSNDVPTMMSAYQLMAEKTDYPLHLGVTHTGSKTMGILKSAMGIGGLLAQGIGDTFRVSLTASTTEEILVGKDILQAVYPTGVDLISCPTCGRCTTDVMGLTQQVETALKDIDFPLTVAVMGCVVNGPGEAKQADLGITGGGNGKCAIFYKGEILRTVPEEKAMEELLKEVDQLRP